MLRDSCDYGLIVKVFFVLRSYQNLTGIDIKIACVGRGHIDKPMYIGLYQLLRNKFYVFFTLLIVEWLWIFKDFRGTSTYLDDEKTSSQRGENDWFPHHFASCMTQHILTWVHLHHPPIAFEIASQRSFGVTSPQQRPQTRGSSPSQMPLAIANPFYVCIFLAEWTRRR